jgi:hypothetical protein
MRRLVLLAVFVLALPVQAAVGEQEKWRRQVAARAHLSFELPPGWKLTELRAGAVVATSFDPPRRWFAGSSPRRLSRDGAVVFVYPPRGSVSRPCSDGSGSPTVSPAITNRFCDCAGRCSGSPARPRPPSGTAVGSRRSVTPTRRLVRPAPRVAPERARRGHLLSPPRST